MSRKGNCLDNSMMENFFRIMKSELLYAEKFESPEDFTKALEGYIDYYNNKRIKVPVKRKESSTIPNSFYNWIVFNQSKFLGSLHQSDTLFIFGRRLSRTRVISLVAEPLYSHGISYGGYHRNRINLICLRIEIIDAFCCR